jgi:hypothetical protein
MPLNRNYKRGIGLQDRVTFNKMDSGMVIFSDIQFTGHPAQKYNITFSIVNLGNELYVEQQTFTASWVVDFQPCPAGQLGTWDRGCECARGFELGGASGCQRCDGGNAINEGDSSNEHGKYKPKPGNEQLCTKCPSKNMITKNSTTRDSVGTCFCAKGYFRAAVIYDFDNAAVPVEAFDPEGNKGFLRSSCGGPGSFVELEAAAEGPEMGRRRRNRNRRQAAGGGEGADNATELNGTEFDLEDFVDATSGTRLVCLPPIEFESVDCGRVPGHVLQDGTVTTNEETFLNCTQDRPPKVCTKCKSKMGCKGDRFGVGVQGCAQYYKGATPPPTPPLPCNTPISNKTLTLLRL